MSLERVYINLNVIWGKIQSGKKIWGNKSLKKKKGKKQILTVLHKMELFMEMVIGLWY